MCNQLPKYGVLIAFLSLFQMAKAQDRTDEFNEKSPFELKFYADTVEIDIFVMVTATFAKPNIKYKTNFIDTKEPKILEWSYEDQQIMKNIKKL